ncbi:hypothetical protein ACH5RR_020236 [Cinchona calisaya]|uniref:PRA1 family protein n=1 Tax=Cinchona calisaya TaxID=153742 RepID=A0ABD2ZDU8_9GENT
MPSGYDSLPSTSSGGGIFTRTKSSTLSFFATRRPWREFLSHPSSYSLPYPPLSELTSRLRRNLNYFRVNYSMIILFILLVSLLWHPISLIVYLIVFVAWWFLYLGRDEPILVLNRMVDDRFVLAALGVVTIVCLVLTGVWLNVLVSILIGVAVVVLHAAFRVTEDLFLDEDEAAAGGLVSVVHNTRHPAPSSRAGAGAASASASSGYTNPF